MAPRNADNFVQIGTNFGHEVVDDDDRAASVLEGSHHLDKLVERGHFVHPFCNHFFFFEFVILALPLGVAKHDIGYFISPSQKSRPVSKNLGSAHRFATSGRTAEIVRRGMVELQIDHHDVSFFHVRAVTFSSGSSIHKH